MERRNKLLEMIKKDPEDSFLRHALALEFLKMGATAEARKIFEELLQKDPEYIGSYYQLGKLLEETQEYEMAAEWYRKGMGVALERNEKKAYGELKSALDEIIE